jgi:glycosyltransferase involved in cell wall biosynthesis
MIEYDLISVIIPTFNRASLIRDALFSVYQQSHRPIELIVVDDGSTDNTEEIVTDFSNEHVSSNFRLIYEYQTNAGGNVARNKGIGLATAEYVAFLDSDDLWMPMKLEKQLTQIKGFDNIGAVYCGLVEIGMDFNGAIDSVIRVFPQGNIHNQLLVKDVTAPTSTYLIRKTAFEKVGFFNEILQARQDWEMWIRISNNFLILAVPENLVFYRKHDGERTISSPTKELNANNYIFNTYIKGTFFKNPILFLKAFSTLQKRKGRLFHHAKAQNIKAFFCFLLSIVSWPLDFDNYAAMMGLFLPKELRIRLHKTWNSQFSKSPFSIKSH